MTEFAPLQFPSAWWNPERLTDVPSWHGHIPFAFAVTEMLRPRVFAELGTHKGDSYAAFCQAITSLGLETKAFAVDTWEGDSQAGGYSSAVYDEFSAWHEPRYSGFSTLLRMTFDAALEKVADGSVDLLHIDGWHTYDAVRHDFETWRPKLSTRGVVLFHDVAVIKPDFGVHRYWDELRADSDHLTFSHSNGLGVLAVGPDIPQPLAGILSLDDTAQAPFLEYFKTLGNRINLTVAAAAKAELGIHVEGLDLAGQRLQQVEAQLREAQEELKRVYTSKSWRVTEPLRSLSEKVSGKD